MPDVPIRCHICGEVPKKTGVGHEGAGNVPVVCGDCLDRVFPERGDLPVEVDADGNLYFIDGIQQKVFLFFAYGDPPYSSCTEIAAEDEGEGCQCGPFLMY